MVAGMYALCHYLPEDPFTKEREAMIYSNRDNHYTVNSNCTIVRWSCKVTQEITSGVLPDRRAGIPTIPANLVLVHVNCLVEPAIAILAENEYYPHVWLAVAGREKWSEIFTQTVLTEEENFTAEEDDAALQLFAEIEEGKNPTSAECRRFRS